MRAWLKMLLFVTLYKIWADWSKRKGLFWKSTAHVKLHKDGSLTIENFSGDGLGSIEGFPWIQQDNKRLIKWFLEEFKEIHAENRSHYQIFLERLKKTNSIG